MSKYRVFKDTVPKSREFLKCAWCGIDVPSFLFPGDHGKSFELVRLNTADCPTHRGMKHTITGYLPGEGTVADRDNENCSFIFCQNEDCYFNFEKIQKDLEPQLRKIGL